jgi:multidrug efflux pump subunit AcrB
VADYRQTIVTALQDVEDSLTAAQQQQLAEAFDQTAADAARQAATLAEAQYKFGTVDFLTVLDAQRTLYQAEDTLVQARLGGGRISAAQYQYTLQAPDVNLLNHWAQVMTQRLSALPELTDVTSDQQASATSATLVIDRSTASRFGITAQAIDDTLYDAFGQRQVATLFTQLNQYHVIEEVDPKFQLTADALAHLYVRSPLTNALVPLSTLAKVENGVSPISVNHQNLFPSVTISFNLASGQSLGNAVNAFIGQRWRWASRTRSPARSREQRRRSRRR